MDALGGLSCRPGKQMNLISLGTYVQVLFEICTYMHLKHVNVP